MARIVITSLAYLSLLPALAASVQLTHAKWGDVSSLADIARLVLAEAHRELQWMTEQRRALHQIPELMFDEHQTSAYIQEQLTALEIPFKAGIAETGIVATIGSGAAPVIALRADMDALPVEEPEDLSAAKGQWRSKHKGVMHACGHDAHMAMLLGAARILKSIERSLNGTVLLVFQPAEEGGGGAKQILSSGALENVTAMSGMHLWPSLPSGTITTKSGVLMAASERFDVFVHGRGAHGAMPHLGNDPIVAGSAIVLALQTLVSRETGPLDSSVVTVGVFDSGIGAGNIIASQVRLEGTIRSLTHSGLERLHSRVEEVALLTARTYGCNATVTWGRVPYLPVVNSPDMVDLRCSRAGALTDLSGLQLNPSLELSLEGGKWGLAGHGYGSNRMVRTVAQQFISVAASATGDSGGACSSGDGTCPVDSTLQASKDKPKKTKAKPESGTGGSVDQDTSESERGVVRVDWLQAEEPVMAAEDFSFYAVEIPSVFTFLGIGDPDKGTNVALHNPGFQVDESVLPLGTALHVVTAVAYLAANAPANMVSAAA